MAKSLLFLQLLILSLLPAYACAPIDLPPIEAAKSFQAEADEKRLWEQSQTAKQRLEKAGLVYEDQELESYLNAVAARLIGDRLQGTNLAPKVKVVKDPFLNAFTFADGSIYFHTGILARMENEAQLAAVMGHELTHFLNRDSVRKLRQKESKAATARVMQAVLILSVLGVFADKLPDAWVTAAVNGYSKEIETAADTGGLRTMVEAGYDPKESIRAINLLKQDWEEAKVKEPYFFGNIARLQERVDNNEHLVRGEYQRQANEPPAGSMARNTAPIFTGSCSITLCSISNWGVCAWRSPRLPSIWRPSRKVREATFSWANTIAGAAITKKP